MTFEEAFFSELQKVAQDEPFAKRHPKLTGLLAGAALGAGAFGAQGAIPKAIGRAISYPARAAVSRAVESERIKQAPEQSKTMADLMAARTQLATKGQKPKMEGLSPAGAAKRAKIEQALAPLRAARRR